MKFNRVTKRKLLNKKGKITILWLIFLAGVVISISISVLFYPTNQQRHNDDKNKITDRQRQQAQSAMSSYTQRSKGEHEEVKYTTTSSLSREERQALEDEIFRQAKKKREREKEGKRLRSIALELGKEDVVEYKKQMEERDAIIKKKMEKYGLTKFYLVTNEESEEESLEMYYEDDTSATVVGLSYSSKMLEIERFVTSLRTNGFNGNIILGLDKNVGSEVLEYLSMNNVIPQLLEPVECSFTDSNRRQKCYKPYGHIKGEWSHFPLVRDWIKECNSCNGAVLFTTVDDVFFQRNPFAKGNPVYKRLQLFEEHPDIEPSKSLEGKLLKACKDVELKTDRLLSAGIAIGPRKRVLQYLNEVIHVMNEWMNVPACYFKHSTAENGGAIVNYIRASARLPTDTKIIRHRMGIVYNVGYEGQRALEAHKHLWKFKGLSEKEAELMPYEGAKLNGTWIDSEYSMTDNEGHFTDIYFQKSIIINQYDTLGKPFLRWLDKSLNIERKESDQNDIEMIEEDLFADKENGDESLTILSRSGKEKEAPNQGDVSGPSNATAGADTKEQEKNNKTTKTPTNPNNTDNRDDDDDDLPPPVKSDRDRPPPEYYDALNAGDDDNDGGKSESENYQSDKTIENNGQLKQVQSHENTSANLTNMEDRVGILPNKPDEARYYVGENDDVRRNPLPILAVDQ